MLSGVVLAAGSASRFGATKQLADLHGKPLAQYAVDAASAAGLDEIVVVVGHEADLLRSALELPATARLVENPHHAAGRSTSLAVGLGAADPDSEGAVVLLADQPGITPAHIRALADAFGERHARIVRLRFRDAPGPALLSREIFDEAVRLRGDVGAAILAESRPDLVEEIALDEPAPLDVDTPADLRRLRERGEKA